MASSRVLFMILPPVWIASTEKRDDLKYIMMHSIPSQQFAMQIRSIGAIIAQIEDYLLVVPAGQDPVRTDNGASASKSLLCSGPANRTRMPR
jgi:hypothetical protein